MKIQMGKWVNLIKRVKNDIVSNETFAVAGEMTYKLTLSVFPLLTFSFSLIGYLNLDTPMLEQQAALFLPEGVSATLFGFVNSLPTEQSTTFLSASIVVALLTSSSGFRSMMRGINKAYGVTDNRCFFVRFLISVALALIFTATLIIAIVVLILRNALLGLLTPYVFTISNLVAFLTNLGAFGIMFVTVTIIYKMSASVKGWRSILPGSLFAVCLWVVLSQLFNFYVNNFPVFSLYGSIAAAFILMLWFNAISVIMLAGAQINSSLSRQ